MGLQGREALRPPEDGGGRNDRERVRREGRDLASGTKKSGDFFVPKGVGDVQLAQLSIVGPELGRVIGLGGRDGPIVMHLTCPEPTFLFFSSLSLAHIGGFIILSLNSIWLPCLFKVKGHLVLIENFLFNLKKKFSQNSFTYNSKKIDTCHYIIFCCFNYCGNFVQVFKN